MVDLGGAAEIYTSFPARFEPSTTTPNSINFSVEYVCNHWTADTTRPKGNCVNPWRYYMTVAEVRISVLTNLVPSAIL